MKCRNWRQNLKTQEPLCLGKASPSEHSCSRMCLRRTMWTCTGPSHCNKTCSMGMPSLKMRMGSFHNLKWFEPMTPQNRGLTNGDGKGQGGRPSSVSKESYRSSPQSANPVHLGPQGRQVDLGLSPRRTCRCVYVVDMSTVRLYCNIITLRFLKSL